MLDKELLKILLCPVSGGNLRYDARKQLLLCEQSGLAYPVRDGIPVLLSSEAQKITDPGRKPGKVTRPGARKGRSGAGRGKA